MDFIVANISEDELDRFSSILREAAYWLKSEGKAMWGDDQVSPQGLLNHYAVREMYIGYVNGEAAAAVILQEEDRLFWPDAKTDSLFIHKLCVRRKYAKTGLSAKMIEWAKGQAKARGKTYIRLDCAADRPKLCAFYEDQGFRKVREQVMFGKYPTAFYETEVD